MILKTKHRISFSSDANSTNSYKSDNSDDICKDFSDSEITEIPSLYASVNITPSTNESATPTNSKKSVSTNNWSNTIPVSYTHLDVYKRQLLN